MLVLSLCPFQVGIVPWASPVPTLSVIVKATFDLRADGEAAFSAQQEALTLDRASPFGAGELESASDFAPQKKRADILLVGYAHADPPSTMIPARLVVDELRVSFVAISGEPSSYVPLSPRYLRTGPSVESAAVTVGPLPPSSQGRAALGRGWGISPEGIPFSPLGQRFDFGFYDVAPLPQQVETIRSNARIRLHNLQEGESRRDVALPGLEPLVFLAGGGAARREVRMRCDTLCVDTEHAWLTLTWRGHVAPFDANDPKARLVVASRKQGEVVPFEKLALAIASARAVPAVEAAHVRAAWDAAARAPAPGPTPALSDDESVLTPVRPGEPEEDDDPIVTPLRPGPPARAQTLVSASLLSFQLTAPATAFVRREPAAPLPPDDTTGAPRAGLGGMRLSMGFRLAAFEAWDEDDASMIAPAIRRLPDEITAVSAAPSRRSVDKPVKVETVTAKSGEAEDESTGDSPTKR